MKALVTGSTGFVGANLVKELVDAGHEVRALYRSSSRLEALAGLHYEPVIGDILDPVSLSSAMDGVDWVFHVAAVADYWRQGGMARLYQVNIGGTRNVMETALSVGIRRVVFTSSVAALGVPHNNASNTPRHSLFRLSVHRDDGRTRKQNSQFINESATFNLPPALSPYGHSKYLAEQMAQEFITRGLEVVIVNPTVILGPRDLNRISGSLILAIYRHQVPAVPPGGVNYIDVADVAAGHIAAAERGRSGERYILAAHNISHYQAVATIAQTIGAPLPRLPLPVTLLGPFAATVDLFNQVWPGEPLVEGNQIRLMKYNLFFDNSKAQQELRLKSPIPFSVSVERAFKWYQENGYLGSK